LYFAAYEQYIHFQLGALPHSHLKCLSRENLLMYVLLQLRQEKVFRSAISGRFGGMALRFQPVFVLISRSPLPLSLRRTWAAHLVKSVETENEV
jgi:hypothetical protein